MNLTGGPARSDLTDRECAKIIGMVIGGLANGMSDMKTVRKAVTWWAESDEAWETLARMLEVERLTKPRNTL